MVKLHLTTIAPKERGEVNSIFIYSKTTLIKELKNTSSSTLVLDDQTADLVFEYEHIQHSISLDQIRAAKQTTLQLSENLSIQLRLSNVIKLLDYTNLILASLSGLLAIGYSIFTNSNWREFLFLLGSTILVLFAFMLLYKHTINARNYNIRMYTAIGALILIFILIPFENWYVKTLIGLSTLTVITRFTKDYLRSFTIAHHPLTKK